MLPNPFIPPPALSQKLMPSTCPHVSSAAPSPFDTANRAANFIFQDYSGALAAFELTAKINPMLLPGLRDNMAVCQAAGSAMLS